MFVLKGGGGETANKRKSVSSKIKKLTGYYYFTFSSTYQPKVSLEHGERDREAKASQSDPISGGGRKKEKKMSQLTD